MTKADVEHEAEHDGDDEVSLPSRSKRYVVRWDRMKCLDESVPSVVREVASVHHSGGHLDDTAVAAVAANWPRQQHWHGLADAIEKGVVKQHCHLRHGVTVAAAGSWNNWRKKVWQVEAEWSHAMPVEGRRQEADRGDDSRAGQGTDPEGTRQDHP